MFAIARVLDFICSCCLEIYAIIISLLYPDIHLLPQPLIYAIANLTTCSNLNLIQSSSTFPFNSNNNSFCSWYLLLWHPKFSIKTEVLGGGGYSGSGSGRD